MTANHRALDDADIMLIERVKQTNALYDPRHPEFRTYRKDQAWAELSISLGISANDAKRRWTCLRDRYSRELKQMRKHPEKDEYGKNEFFRQMDFLRKFVKVRRERRRTGVLDTSSESCANSEKYDTNSKVEQMYEEDDGEAEETHVYDDTKHSYDGKEEICHDSTSYPEYVEVDASVSYEDYVEPTHVTDNEATSTNNKLGNGVMPVLITAPTSTSPAFTLKTTKSVTPPQLIYHHQHTEQTDYTQLQQQEHPPFTETEDDYFSKSVAAYLRQLSRRNKIKAKVEMFQILEKYIELEENNSVDHKTD